MRLFAVALVVAAAGLAVCSCDVNGQAPNPPPIWPVSFQARFGLDQTPILHAPIVNSTSYFYYNLDPAVNGQLIDYPEYCPASPKLLGGIDHGCKILFNSIGIFVSQPTLGIECCTLFDGVGPTPRNFTRGFVWNNTEFAADYFGIEHESDKYIGGDQPFQFLYWTEVQTHHDIRFHDGAGANWAWDRLNVTTIPASQFALFSDNQTCSASCTGAFGIPLEQLQANAAKHAPIALALHHHNLKQQEDKWAQHLREDTDAPVEQLISLA